MSIRRILIAVDNQPASVRAAEFGSEIGRSLGGEIGLINSTIRRRNMDEPNRRARDCSVVSAIAFRCHPPRMNLCRRASQAQQLSKRQKNGPPTSSSSRATDAPACLERYSAASPRKSSGTLPVRCWSCAPKRELLPNTRVVLDRGAWD